LHRVANASILRFRSATESNEPRRIAWFVISANQRSTWFNHAP
jgi:hypothetical protein